MRYYPVPYSTKEEAKMIFNLSSREFALLLGGALAGIVLAVLLSAITRVYFFILAIPCVPLFFGAGAYIAFKSVKEIEAKVTLDKHYMNVVKYKMRPHIYIMYRRPVKDSPE